jgi:glycosyltransferase involved in cell wall biosynthesis
MLRPHIDIASSEQMPRVVMFGSGKPLTCAVMDYAARLTDAINDARPGFVRRDMIEPENPGAFVEALRRALWRGHIVHLQLPIEGWGNSVLPGIAPLLARLGALGRGRLVVTLHEWSSLHPLRHLSMIPGLPVADRFVFVSEAQRAAFLSTPWVRPPIKRAAPVIPIGPNIMPPAIDERIRERERAALLGTGDLAAELVVGFFGVLYASKRPDILLRTLKQLHATGRRARLLICGDFLHDKPQDREAFFMLARELGIADWLSFRGRIDDETELVSTLAASDVFLLPYTDGISTRRGSFQAVAPLAIPVVSTRPERADEFDASPLLKAKVTSEATVLIQRDAPPVAFADAIARAYSAREHARPADLKSLWTDAALATLKLYDSL